MNRTFRLYRRWCRCKDAAVIAAVLIAGLMVLGTVQQHDEAAARRMAAEARR
jgi:hypothetical protein